MKINYEIAELAQFRHLRNKSKKGDLKIRVVSNYSHQYLEWAISGHLKTIGIDDFTFEESFFEDFYYEECEKINCDILIISFYYNYIFENHHLPREADQQIVYIINRLEILQKKVKKDIIFIPQPPYAKFIHKNHRNQIYDNLILP